ncbi:hypothetical protein C8Q73DRAFT_76909 [Cubamyces lactineus]|nr:hypothetical protein C8Q73DRAFT_76909 [Cubamyces lactineus]
MSPATAPSLTYPSPDISLLRNLYVISLSSRAIRPRASPSPFALISHSLGFRALSAPPPPTVSQRNARPRHPPSSASGTAFPPRPRPPTLALFGSQPSPDVTSHLAQCVKLLLSILLKTRYCM